MISIGGNQVSDFRVPGQSGIYLGPILLNSVWTGSDKVWPLAVTVKTDIQIELENTTSSPQTQSIYVEGNSGDKFKVDTGYNPATQASGSIQEYTFSSQVAVNTTVPANGSVVIRIYDTNSEIAKVRTWSAPDAQWWEAPNTPAATIKKIFKVKSERADVDLKRLFARQTLLTNTNVFNTSQGGASGFELSSLTSAWGIGGIDYIFEGCTGLTSAGLWFNSMVNCQSFAGIFSGCSNLSTIPLDIFKYNVAAYSFEATFLGNAITAIPSGGARTAPALGNISIFDSCKSAGHFGNTFNNCTQLQTIPEYLFWYQSVSGHGQILFEVCFANCMALTAVPRLWGLAPTGATWSFHVWSMFTNCQALSAIHEDLFLEVGPWIIGGQEGGLNNTFENCLSLSAIPAKLLHTCKNLSVFSNSFNHMGYWMGTPIFPYNMFWGVSRNIGTFNLAFAGLNGTPSFAPCFFRVMKRDGSGNPIKSLTLPYYNASQNKYWDSTGEHAGMPGGQYVSDSDLEPMKISYLYNHDKPAGFTNTFYNTYVANMSPGIWDGLEVDITSLMWNIDTNLMAQADTSILAVPSVASTLINMWGMYFNRQIGKDIQTIFGAASYPNLDNTQLAFRDTDITGNAIPLITGKLAHLDVVGGDGLKKCQGMFAGCTGLSDYAAIQTSYPDWVNHPWI